MSSLARPPLSSVEYEEKFQTMARKKSPQVGPGWSESREWQIGLRLRQIRFLQERALWYETRDKGRFVKEIETVPVIHTTDQEMSWADM